MDQDFRLPLKVVVPGPEDIRLQESTGGSRKQFGRVTPKTRESLISQLRVVGSYFEGTFDRMPDVPAVAKVTLKPKALAKSHRPAELLHSGTCPVIGVDDLGELLVTVTPGRLRLLSEAIRDLDTQAGLSSISAIDRFEPYSAFDELGSSALRSLKTSVDDAGAPLKLRLFRHGDSRLDDAVMTGLRRQLASLGLASEVEQVFYSPTLRVLRIRGASAEQVEPLARFVGTQRLGTFPMYRVVRTEATAVRRLCPDDLPSPAARDEYPVVGIVDTGTDPADPYVSSWVSARENFVAGADIDHRHGSFVAGLVIHAHRLNHSDPRFPSVSARIVDVAAVPRSGEISEDELVAILEEVLPKHPEVRVWNLSLGTSSTCTDSDFSDLGVALDRLQDEYNVVFVMAAGNYDQLPLRGWPPEDLGEADRICAPADSVRGVAVGSVAHRDTAKTRVRSGEPSPFTRRGPGPVYLPKPDVTHYAGNCDPAGNYIQAGVLSTDGQGHLAEDVGTSFASPIVASLLANVESALRRPVSRSLLKALLVHSAALSGGRIDVINLRYRGFGVPSDLGGVLSCNPWSATLIFETGLVPRYEFEKNPFPIPACLRTDAGRVVGEIVMTLVYDPPLDPSFGVEYCRTNVEASLGTYAKNADGKYRHTRQVPPEPRDVNLLYERQLIEHGFKWSPVKVYRRLMKRGVGGQDWRLRAAAIHRYGFSTDVPQDFALLVTLRDPEKRKPVYDQTVRLVNQLGWATVDLEVRARLRPRP